MILLIDNYDSFTWNLVQRFGEIEPSLIPERDLIVVRNDAITPDQAQALDGGKGPTHLVISPGPCTPSESGVSRAMISRFAGRIPVLGVCLGHQCMAELAGMRVHQHDKPMHGKTSMMHHDSTGLFAGLPSPFCATRYHSLVADFDAVPSGWHASAWTDEPGSSGQSQRVLMGLSRVWDDPGKAPMEGVQFHPESFLTDQGHQLLGNFLNMAPLQASC